MQTNSAAEQSKIIRSRVQQIYNRGADDQPHKLYRGPSLCDSTQLETA